MESKSNTLDMDTNQLPENNNGEPKQDLDDFSSALLAATLNAIECGPIPTYEDVFHTLKNPPEWSKRIIDLIPRGEHVIANANFPCHLRDNKTVCPPRLDKSLTSRTIVCHDMRNGYLLDRFADPVRIGNGYTFYMWQCIDALIYFSHHFITIPPLQWINVGHRNGVQILGTILTEWTQGEKMCATIFKDRDTVQTFADAIVALSEMFKLDGWLINIENPVKNVALVIEFLRLLTIRMHKARPGSIVIWYDSVTDTGELKWQNELNYNNICYFNVCDGIFLNYTWTPRNLAASASLAQHRCFDVYVGVDVFARNTTYAAGPESYQSVRNAREASLSVALFAPGWTHESIKSEPQDDFFQRFLDNDRLFWGVLWPYLYTHPVTQLFETDFYIGMDDFRYNLTSQQQQLAHVVGCNVFERHFTGSYRRCPCLQLLYEVSQYGIQTSVLLKRNYTIMDASTLHHLQATSIDLRGSYVFYTMTSICQVETREVNLDIVLVIMEDKRTTKMVLYCGFNRPLQRATHFIKCLPPGRTHTIMDSLNIGLITDCQNLKCFWLNFPKSVKLLHIYGTFSGANSLVLHGFGIRKLD